MFASSSRNASATWVALLSSIALGVVGARALCEESGPALTQEGLRIAFIGDGGSGNADQKAVARQLRRFEDELRHIMLLGDNVYWTGRPERFQAAFFKPYRRLLERRTEEGEPQVAFHSALGNHDVKRCAVVRRDDGTLARDHQAYSWQDPACFADQHLAEPAFGYRDGQRYYSIELRRPGGQALAELYVMDTDTLPSEKHPDRVDQLQLEWLEESIRASRQRAEESGVQPWRIVAMHHPIRTPGAKGYLFGQGGHRQDATFLETMYRTLQGPSDDRDQVLGKQLQPLLGKVDVDAVFAGHNHFYARLVPEADRIRHFVSGGGGIPVYEPDMTTAAVASGGGFHHFVTAVLTPERFEYCTIDSLGRIRDHGYWLKSRPEDDDRPLGRDRHQAVCRP